MPRRDYQRSQLLTAGLKALAALIGGAKPADLLLTFPGSRATFYRALRVAQEHEARTTQIAAPQHKTPPPNIAPQHGIDPLLL